MTPQNPIYCFTITFILLSSLTATADAQVERENRSWHENTFGVLRDRVRDQQDMNLLVFPGAKLENVTGVDNIALLTDGEVGIYGGEGRAAVNGNPSTIRYYLGKAQKIREIILYSGNIDSRSNQDFEIRLANNAAHPGTEPDFPKEPTLTSGDRIIGSNSGAFMTRFFDASGKALSDAIGGENAKFDWIEFRLWRTYPSKVGDPAKAGNKSAGWASYLELQVLGDPDDPNLFADEQERHRWLEARDRERFERHLKKTVGDDVVAALEHPESLRRAIDDLAAKFPDRYDAETFTERYDTVVTALTDAKTRTEEQRNRYIELVRDFARLRKEALLANPLLDFQTLLFRRAKNAGLTNNWISNAARGKGGYDNALATVDPRNAGGDATTIIKDPNGSFVGDVNLHWDADRMLVTALSENKTWQVFELNVDGSGGLKQVTSSAGPDVDNVEGCYVPDGATLFISTANMMGVPCIDGSSPVGNIYRLEPDGKTIRQLTFEQDQDWCPVLMPNGRVLYLRWEYIDTPHYFTRLLFHMNPDGTNQIEYYGSNGYWPNSMFYARPIPGNTTKIATIVSGHHGVSRMGELVLFDIAKGRKEAEGVIQRIPGYGKKVEPIIQDQLVDDSWPKFLFPAPLDENYLIVSGQLSRNMPWALYLVDTFDNMLLLREEPGYGLFEPTPIVKQPKPPVRPDMVDPASEDSTLFVTDVYFGEGLVDVPRGTVKKFRVFSYNYGYRGIGSHNYFGMESCWDARRILGEVPVYEDGSASFLIPANTPLAIQPLDEQGRAVQTMRSWLVGMPAENQSCSGCHESQNTVTPNRRTVAMGKPPVRIKPFLGPERPFSFKHEIQPVLDRYCVGCHDGAEDRRNRPNFADTEPGPYGFSKSYHALHPFVRRPGPEGDYYMLKPMEFHASSSELFLVLEKGHYGVRVDPDSMRKLYAWADLNVPYFGTWMEIAQRLNRPQIANVAARAAELRGLYAGSVFNPEVEPYAGLETPERIEFVNPEKVERDDSAPRVPNWPFDEETARTMQNKPNQTLAITPEITIELAWIPPGRFVMGDQDGYNDELPRGDVEIGKPFRMMTTEVTNELYRLFDPGHDSRYIDQWSKDHTHPGYPANEPKQPVIRINWNQANEFCRWLSRKTGQSFRLPTEAEWEWAARAGSETPMWYGLVDADFGKLENLADMQTKKFVVRGVNPQPIANPPEHEAFIPRAEGIDDGMMIAGAVGSYRPNPWGLYDMHGNVSEWTASDYRPYPYRETDRNDPSIRKVARGGSWRDRPKMSRSGIRRPYEAWQPVYNVGFRVVCEE